MRSDFLPNYPPINALVCCGNPGCNNNEAEAEDEAELFKPLSIMCPNCRTAHYCTVDCQQADRENHQQQCNQDAEKLKERNEWLERNHNKENTDNDDDIVDELLFQAIPPQDDCIICTLPLPIDNMGTVYNSCCGNTICHGCWMKNSWVTKERGRQLIPQRELDLRCPFCRKTTPASDNEFIIRNKKRMELNDSNAIFIASQYYKKGKCGLPQEPERAFQLCLRASELGNTKAYNNLGLFYKEGVVVPKDMAKAKGYYEMAAKKGNIEARYNLGMGEMEKENYQTAGKHLLISAAAGDALSLVEIADCYKYRHVTKKEYITALTSYIQVQNDEYSIERKRAATVD